MNLTPPSLVKVAGHSVDSRQVLYGTRIWDKLVSWAMYLGAWAGNLLEVIAFYTMVTRRRFGQLSRMVLGPVRDDKIHTENW